jgi:ABC-2 type transport system permease protein
VAELAGLYVRLVRARVRAQLQYRTSFVLDVVSTALVSMLDFAVVLVLFHNVPQLGGWNLHEVALLYGIAGIAFAASDMLVGQLDGLSQMVRDGTFDLLLVRPRGTLLQVVTSDFAIRRVGRILQAAAVLVWALAAVHVDWTVGRVVMLPVAIICGTVIFASVWVVFSCVIFIVIDGREASSAFTYGGSALTQYPMTVYGPWLRRLLGFLVPLAFVAFEPALYILDKPDPFGLPDATRLASPLVALAAVGVAGLIWQAAVRRYRSAGG